MTVRVLVAEPEDGWRNTLTNSLARHGYSVSDVATGREAIQHGPNVDVAILGLNMPDTDGVNLCKEFRCRPDVVVLAFSAHPTEVEDVLALQAGADHCLAKGLGIHEIIARIEAVQRRIGGQQMRQEVNLGANTLTATVAGRHLEIDQRTRHVTLDETELVLTNKEFCLLVLLVDQLGKTVPRKVIMEKVWLDNSGVGTRTLDTHVCSLRRKLSSNRSIACVRQFGYRFQST